MGFLGVGRPIGWPEMTDEICDYIRLHGVIQFLYQYYLRQHVEQNGVEHPLKWGEEIEYTLVAFDSDTNAAPARLSMRAHDILEDLKTYSERSTFKRYCTWMPEYATWMLEATPGLPYGDLTSDLLLVEPAMQMRRHALRPFLHPLEAVLSITVFPRIGCPDGLLNPAGDPVRGPIANSRYVPDTVINPHPRFGTLTANIRNRRGANVDVSVPLLIEPGTPARFPHLGLDAGVAASCSSLRHSTDDGRASLAHLQPAVRVCDDCPAASPTSATVECVECKLALCAPCDTRLHGGRISSTHARSMLPVVGNPMESSTNNLLAPLGTSPQILSSVTALAGGGVSPSVLGETPEVAALLSGEIPCPTGRLPEAQPVPELDANGKPVIPMDAMAFGMGTSCLQATFQCRSLSEARTLYDQLAVLTPYVTALSAASPVYMGLLAATDCRWAQIAASVDDRTPFERGHGPDLPPLSAEAAKEAQEGAEKAGKEAAAAAKRLFEAWKGSAPPNDDHSRPNSTGAGLRTSVVKIDDEQQAALDAAVNEVKPLSAGGAGTFFRKARGAVLDTRLEAGAPHNGARRLHKSRYDAVSLFIADENDKHMRDEYNDTDVEIDETAYQAALAGGLDSRLARHLAYIMARDPLVVFSDRLQMNDTTTTEHYDNLASTNWNSMRLKLPPPGRDDIGWRVEFRPLEVQFTDFENAAFVVFVVLLSRIILLFDLNFYIPVSRVDENFHRAHLQNAAVKQKFYVRRHICEPGSSAASLLIEGLRRPLACARQQVGAGGGDENAVVELSLDQIMNGCSEEGNEFPGLLPLCNNYLDLLEMDGPAREMVTQYFELLGKRASGELQTPAKWIRSFITSHRAYRGDSVVSQQVSSDLLHTIQRITEGKVCVKELYGLLYPRPPDAPGADKVPLIPDVPSGYRPPLVPVRHAGRELVTSSRQLLKSASKSVNFDELADPYVSSSDAIVKQRFAVAQRPTDGVSFEYPLSFEQSHLPKDLMRILTELRAFHPQFCAELGSTGPTMCNHTYMTLIALAQMGASMDTVSFWYENARFEPVRAPRTQPTFTLTNWASHIGSGSLMYSPYRTLFEDLLTKHPRKEVLAGVLPYLIRSLTGGAFHPLIRLSYAIHDLDGAIADSLAYFALRGGKMVVPRGWEAAIERQLARLPEPWNQAAGGTANPGTDAHGHAPTSPVLPSPGALPATSGTSGAGCGSAPCPLASAMNVSSDPTTTLTSLLTMAVDRFQDRTFDSLRGLLDNVAFVRLCGLLKVCDSTAEKVIVDAARLAARLFEVCPSFSHVHAVIGSAALFTVLPLLPDDKSGFKALAARVYVTYVVGCYVIARQRPPADWETDTWLGPSPDALAESGGGGDGSFAGSMVASRRAPSISVSREAVEERWKACVDEAIAGADVHRITLVRAARLLSGVCPGDPTFLRVCEWQRRAGRAF